MKNDVKKLLKGIEEKKKKIAVLRDKLRGDFCDLEDLLSTLDTGIDEIDEGCRALEYGIDKMSELL